MVRNYVKKNVRAQWSTENMEKAFTHAIQKKLSIHQSAKTFGVPYPTLRNRVEKHINGAVPLGKKPVFSKEQEEEICRHVLELSKLFHGVTPLNFRRIIFDFAVSNWLLR